MSAFPPFGGYGAIEPFWLPPSVVVPSWPVAPPLLMPPAPPMPFVTLPPMYVHRYQPPTSSAEAALWSAVHLRCLIAAKHIVSKILPRGHRERRLYRTGDYIVALKRCFVPDIGRDLECGEWVFLPTGACGQNLVELYAFVHWCGYAAAVHALAEEASLIGPNGVIRHHGDVRYWRQERQPLHRDTLVPLGFAGYPLDGEALTYFNASGHATLQVIRWGVRDEGKVCVYRSLWRHHLSAESQWAEVFPQKPYPLFNEHLLRCRPDCPVILVEDEFQAHASAGACPNFVLSAVPGGVGELARGGSRAAARTRGPGGR